MKRRRFIQSIGGILVAAPAVVSAANIMSVHSIRRLPTISCVSFTRMTRVGTLIQFTSGAEGGQWATLTAKVGHNQFEYEIVNPNDIPSAATFLAQHHTQEPWWETGKGEVIRPFDEPIRPFHE